MINKQSEEYYKWLIGNGIVEKGHFILRSGKHSDTYIRKTKIILCPTLYGSIIHNISKNIQLNFKPSQYDVITGPAVAGMCFAAPVSKELNVPLVFSEKKQFNDTRAISLTNYYKMIFRKEFRNYIKRKKIIIIEDIITTGSSVFKTADAIIEQNGIPVAVFCIWNRNPDITMIKCGPYEIPIYSIIYKRVKSWNDSEDCPICSANRNINNKTGI